MRGKIMFVVMLAFICAFAFSPTYSYYINVKNVSVTSTSSYIMCDAEIEEVSSDEESIYGYSEFKVVVKNYDAFDNVTGENYNYTLTIENDNTSSGLFGYDNDNFASSLTFDGSMTNTSATDNSYIIQVKSTSGLAEDVDYKVSLSCMQTV